MLFVVALILAVIIVAGILTISIIGLRKASSRKTALEESGGVHADRDRQDPPTT